MGYSEMPALGQGKEILVKEGWPTPTPTPTPEVPSLIEFSVAPQSVAKGDTVTVKLQTTGVWGYWY